MLHHNQGHGWSLMNSPASICLLACLDAHSVCVLSHRCVYTSHQVSHHSGVMHTKYMASQQTKCVPLWGLTGDSTLALMQVR